MIAICVYFIEVKLMKCLLDRLIADSSNVKFVAQFYLFTQDMLLPEIPEFPMAKVHDYMDYHFDTIVSLPEWIGFSQESVKFFLNRCTIRITEARAITASRNWCDVNLPETES